MNHNGYYLGSFGGKVVLFEKWAFVTFLHFNCIVEHIFLQNPNSPQKTCKKSVILSHLKLLNSKQSLVKSAGGGLWAVSLRVPAGVHLVEPVPRGSG